MQFRPSLPMRLHNSSLRRTAWRFPKQSTNPAFDSPIGLSAARNNCTRRSVFVNVPSRSANDCAGKTTSACFAVSVRNKSCTTRKSGLTKPPSAAGSHAITYNARTLPDVISRAHKPFASTFCATNAVIGNQTEIDRAGGIVVRIQRDQTIVLATDMPRDEQ